MTNEEAEINWDEVKLQWHSDLPLWDLIDQIILDDCRQNLWGLGAVRELIFHTIFLDSTSMNRDVVTVWGDGETDVLHCEYSPVVKWVDGEGNTVEDDDKPDDF